jgi:outer membrane protein TolC
MGVVEAEAGLNRAQAAFRKVVGISADTPVEAERLEQTAPVSNETRREFVTGNSLNRPEYKVFDAAMEATTLKAESERSGFRPRVMLQGAANYGKPGVNLPANEWMHYFSAGVSLNWALWDWGHTERAVEKAELEGRKIEHERAGFERAITEQAAQAEASYDEALARVELAEKAAQLAEERLALVTDAYNEGMATETDYENAHRAFEKAKHEQNVAKTAVSLSRAYIEYVYGERYFGENYEQDDE